MLKYTREKPMCKWMNLYGAHNNYRGSTSTKMNLDPAEAAAWKGRLLVQWFTEDIKYPIMKIRNIIDKSAKEDVKLAMQEKDYSLWVEFGEGICLPEAKKYTLRLVIGSIVIESGAPKKQGN